mmetsp:Transcript_82411/g.191420  ORF Transcript_82411/g.191420 Transcript_82411/m.191420 type:complete len:243 (-) Transcript_82411:555-1283(-)
MSKLLLLRVPLNLQSLLRGDRFHALHFRFDAKRLLVRVLIVVDSQALLEVRVGFWPVPELRVRARADLEGFARVGVDAERRCAVVHGCTGSTKLQQQVCSPAVHQGTRAPQDYGCCELLERQQFVTALQGVGGLLLELPLPFLLLVREELYSRWRHGRERRFLGCDVLRLVLAACTLDGQGRRHGDGQHLLLVRDADPALSGPASAHLLVVEAVPYQFDLHNHGTGGEAVRRDTIQRIESLR